MFRRISILLFAFVFLFSHSSKAENPLLIQHTVGDTTSTFTKWPVFIFAGGIVATTLVISTDDNVQNYFTSHHFSKKLNDTANWVGDPYILGAASAITYGASLLGDNQKFKLTSETMVEALFFNAVITEGLKYGFQRKRPNGGSYSFPSGHTSSAFTIASVFQMMQGSKVGIPAYLAAAVIGFTRIDSNNHHLSDVVFGAALGTSIGLGTSLFHQKENTRLLISPILDQTRGIMLSCKF